MVLVLKDGTYQIWGIVSNEEDMPQYIANRYRTKVAVVNIGETKEFLPEKEDV